MIEAFLISVLEGVGKPLCSLQFQPFLSDRLVVGESVSDKLAKLPHSKGSGERSFVRGDWHSFRKTKHTMFVPWVEKINKCRCFCLLPVGAVCQMSFLTSRRSINLLLGGLASIKSLIYLL